MLCTITRKASGALIALENGVKQDASFGRHSSTRIRKECCLGSGLGALKQRIRVSWMWLCSVEYSLNELFE